MLEEFAMLLLMSVVVTSIKFKLLYYSIEYVQKLFVFVIVIGYSRIMPIDIHFRIL